MGSLNLVEMYQSMGPVAKGVGVILIIMSMWSFGVAIERFYTSGVPVAVGTDSLASTPDLNLFAELAAMRTLAPGVPAAMLLDSATCQGARASVRTSTRAAPA